MKKPNLRQSTVAARATDKPTDVPTRRRKAAPKIRSVEVDEPQFRLFTANARYVFANGQPEHRNELDKLAASLRELCPGPKRGPKPQLVVEGMSGANISIILVDGNVPMNKRSVAQAVSFVPTSVQIGRRKLVDLKQGERIAYTDGTGKYYGTITRSPHSDEFLMDCRVVFGPAPQEVI